MNEECPYRKVAQNRRVPAVIPRKCTSTYKSRHLANSKTNGDHYLRMETGYDTFKATERTECELVSNNGNILKVYVVIK